MTPIRRSGRIINTSVVAGFGVSVTVAASNSPGAPSGGLLQVQSLDIQNLSATPASLVIRVSDAGFTQPGGAGSPMLLSSSVGGTFTLGNVGDNVTFQSFADPNNAQPAGAVASPAQSFSKLNPALTTESFSSLTSAPFTRNAGAYSLTNITTTTLSAGGQLNISGTTTATAVPEPTTLALVGFGVTGLVVRRRR